MHIKISKSSLTEALNNVASVAGSKTSLPVLQNVKIQANDGAATFVCSDLDTTLVATAECEVVEPGETTIPVKNFAAASGKVVDGLIDLVVVNDNAKVTAGTSQFSFKGISAKEFPTIPETTAEPVTIDCAAIREMFRKTAFAMCTDDTRRTLKSVLLDFSKGEGKALAVATDGRRLSLINSTVEVPAGFNKSFIIPSKAVDILVKKLPKDSKCDLIVSKSQLRFVTAKLELYTKLIDDAYPNYMQVVPKSVAQKVVVDRAELAGAIDRISIFTETDAPTMGLVLADNKIVLSSGETEYGSSRDEVAIKYEGEKIEMKFNPQYVRDVLNVLDEDEVEIGFNNSSSPAVIRKVGSEDYIYVVMPLRTT